MEKDLENQVNRAEFDGTVAAVAQTAQQNYLQQNAPSEAQANELPNPNSNNQNK